MVINTRGKAVYILFNIRAFIFVYFFRSSIIIESYGQLWNSKSLTHFSKWRILCYRWSVRQLDMHAHDVWRRFLRLANFMINKIRALATIDALSKKSLSPGSFWCSANQNLFKRPFPRKRYCSYSDLFSQYKRHLSFGEGNICNISTLCIRRTLPIRSMPPLI